MAERPNDPMRDFLYAMIERRFVAESSIAWLMEQMDTPNEAILLRHALEGLGLAPGQTKAALAVQYAHVQGDLVRTRVDVLSRLADARAREQAEARARG